MNSFIKLNKMKFYAFHGVSKQERNVGNTFIVDITLSVDLSIACETDNLSDTVSYATIYELIKEEMNIPSNLLEHVAFRIIKKIKVEFPFIKKVEIYLSKLNPPFGGDIQSATIVLNE